MEFASTPGEAMKKSGRLATGVPLGVGSPVSTLQGRRCMLEGPPCRFEHPLGSSLSPSPLSCLGLGSQSAGELHSKGDTDVARLDELCMVWLGLGCRRFCAISCGVFRVGHTIYTRLFDRPRTALREIKLVGRLVIYQRCLYYLDQD